jgi:murein L,D-transpeptidase YcbB/YkuD
VRFLRHSGSFCFLMVLSLVCTQGGAAEQGTPLLWLHHGLPSAQALAVIGQMRTADRYGLRPADYDVDTLVQQMGQLATTNAGVGEARDAMARNFDRTLSAAALRFITHLHSGRVSARSAGFDIEESRPAFNGPENLHRLAVSTDVAAELRSVEPPFLHYQLLKNALQRYRLPAAQSDLTQLPPFASRSLACGDHYQGAPTLRRLLRAVGDFGAHAPEPQDSQMLDAGMCAALRRFQDRHGLSPDGVLGRNTFRALTVPLSGRVRQIELTLERWRWLPPFATPPIIINIPQFRLFAFRTTQDRVADILQMPVIVGRAYPRMRTPVFMADMRYVIFRPYWNVPPSIVRHEMLAAIRKSVDYLARNDLELVRGESDEGPVIAPDAASIDALARGELRLRQRPGVGNALGLIKFDMPNRYNVYLHSTPEQHLFDEAQRAFSHGCIRVGNPLALAAHVLRGTAGEWSPLAIEAAMHGDRTLRVPLAQPIPVLVLYGTELAKEDGQVMFFDDIYGHDRRLEHLLATKGGG